MPSPAGRDQPQDDLVSLRQRHQRLAAKHGRQARVTEQAVVDYALALLALEVAPLAEPLDAEHRAIIVAAMRRLAVRLDPPR